MNKNLLATISQDQLEIEVFGADLDGFQFVEHTRTVTIARDGATIPLGRNLAPDSELIIRNPATNEEAVARVVDLIHDENFVHVYGITFVNSSTNLWQVESPDGQAGTTITLECSGCKTVNAVSLSEIELEIFRSKQALSRHCECSKSSTV